MRKIGLIVGNGLLPRYFLEKAADRDLEVFPVGLFDTIDEVVKKDRRFRAFNIGQVGDIVKYFLLRDVRELILLGKVEKRLIFQDLQLDSFGEELLKKLPDRKDETLLFGVISFLRLNGIRVLDQTKFIEEFLLKKKRYTKQAPDETDLLTIKTGVEAAKALSRVDAGQCVICKDRSVVALEGIEGTDRCIRRGGELAGAGTIVVKMARPQQNMKVDVPVIGIETVRTAAAVKARGVVGESGKMMLLDEADCIRIAEENNMFIIGV
ncbi:MAG: UDP-2,3-diacylglucosamine diphosphatase LpxI [Fusobacteriaceae bacterium]|jgi:DUF1009 family protein|nr:UDP-2,3-diacylglucosamine diphosphatase LpxI [Fusobacteriaceae bacterium]